MKTLRGALFIRLQSGFSRRDLLAIVTLLCVIVGILLPATISKTQSKAEIAKCLDNLKQYGAAHSTLFQDGAVRFEGWPRLWIRPFHAVDPTLKDTFCPAAPARPADSLVLSPEGGQVDRTWVVSGGQTTNQGSYGFNGFFYLDSPFVSGKESFKSPAMVTDPSRTPVFADSVWVDFWPNVNDLPARDLLTGDNYAKGGLSRIAIPRHAARRSAAARDFDASNTLPGAVNLVFVDNHAETVGLEKLWGFSWHRDWVNPPKRPGLP